MLATGAGRTATACLLTGAGWSKSASNSSSNSACSTRPRYSPTFRIAPAMRNSVSPIDVTLPRLAGRTTHTEHRTPDSQVCRPSRNGRLEVPAHSRRDDHGIGMVGTQLGRQAYEVLEVGQGVLAKGCNR